MPSPRTSPPLLLLLLTAGVAAVSAAMLAAWSAEAASSGPGPLATTGIAAIGAVAGFRCGRLMLWGARAARRRCDSCGARRTGTGAFCESCGWRD
jgi:hypothetical protein